MLDFIPLWLVLGSLFIFGSILGSFAGAQVWRLRARQLHDDTKRRRELRLKTKRGRSAEEQSEYSFLTEIDTPESRQEHKRLKPLLKETTKTDRSRCLACEQRLVWYDLMPVVSWLSTGGRCRYCRQPIGRFEILMEAGLGVFFMLSFLFWPFGFEAWWSLLGFGLWLAVSVPMTVLFAYDAKWYLLPSSVMRLANILALIYAGVMLVGQGLTPGAATSLVAAVGVIAGLYWLLYIVSRGAWVGGGDAVLGIGLGLLLLEWPLAVVAVVLANAIGSLLVLPGLLTGSLDRQSHIPFGPLLIVGTVLAHWWGDGIVDWYLGLL